MFQMTYTGAPSIYYGDEIGLPGGHDPFNRAAFPWSSSEWDSELLHEFQRLIAFRKSRASLRRGGYRTLLAEGSVHVHLRELDGEAVVVALNTSTSPTMIERLPLGGEVPDGTVMEDPWSHQGRAVEGGGAWADRASAPLRPHLRDPLAMSGEAPAPWRLPEGVNPSLWHYAQSERLAQDEDAYFRDHPLFEADARLLDERFAAPGRVVDLGCGAGRHSVRFAARGFDVASVDLSRPMLAKVREKAQANGLAIATVRANLCRLGCFRDETFDYALAMFSTLGMIRGATARRHALAEAARVLRPGGRLALHAHNVWLNLGDLQGRRWLAGQVWDRFRGRSGFGDRRMTYRGVPGMEVHLYRWRELRADLRAAGLRIEEAIALDAVTARPIPMPRLFPGVRAGGWVVFAARPEG